MKDDPVIDTLGAEEILPALLAHARTLSPTAATREAGLDVSATRSSLIGYRAGSLARSLSSCSTTSSSSG
jgi:hypothetical protein